MLAEYYFLSVLSITYTKQATNPSLQRGKVRLRNLYDLPKATPLRSGKAETGT